MGTPTEADGTAPALPSSHVPAPRVLTVDGPAARARADRRRRPPTRAPARARARALLDAARADRRRAVGDTAPRAVHRAGDRGVLSYEATASSTRSGMSKFA